MALFELTDDYFAGLLTNLQPTGDAWPTDSDAVQQQAFAALATTFAALNSRANYLVKDAFPATALELLPQWEASLGLPDPCTPLATTIQQRQAAVDLDGLVRDARRPAFRQRVGQGAVRGEVEVSK